jgi:hypothetical protein
MKGKKLRTVTLSKETIRILAARDLAHVAGVGESLSCPETCECDMKTTPTSAP